MEIIVIREAERELDAAVQYYNEQRLGLGCEFAEEIQHAFTRIRKYPDAFSPYSKYTRRCLVDRFPYGILYSLENRRIVILGIMNLRQNPEHWRDRL